MKDEAGRREHCDEVLAKCEEEIKLLEKLMRESDSRIEATVFEEEDVSQVTMEIGICNNLFAGSLKSMNEYESVIREIEQRLSEDGKEAVGIKQFQSEDNRQQVKGVEVHYCEPKQEDIIRTDGVEEKLTDSLMNSTENLNQHTDMLTEEEEIEKQTEMLPKKEEAPRPHVFNFNKCFVNTDFVQLLEEIWHT